MPRFVSKDDVQKGLVDPTKPLHQQPEYQKKLQQQQKHKQTQHQTQPKKQHKEPHHKKQHKEPHHKKQNKEHHQNKQQKEENQKHQYKQKKPRRQRQDRPQFNWNKKQITLQTKVPQAPKKILPKPDGQKFKNEITKLRELKDNLYQQRKKLIDQQSFLIKSNNDSKKSGFSALSKYGLELREKTTLKKTFYDKIHKLEDQRNNIENQLKTLKDQNGALRNPKDLELMSTEQLKEKIANLQQRLSSANLDKKEQTQINNNINLAKRALIKARPDIQIKTQVSKNDDKIKILTEDSKALKKQIDAVYKQLKPIKAEIDELLKKKKQQEGTITEVKSIEQIRADYDKKIKEVDAKRDEAQKKMDELKEKYYKDLDLYEDQQDLLRYIKYVQDEIDYKRKRKQQEEKWRKEKEQKELKKKKQFEERQKRREERKKQEEERKQREEERKQKLQAERDAFINRNPNWQSIDLCEFMIKYCENIRPETQSAKSNEQKGPKGDINLTQHQSWKKQAKSGCEVIVSKKSKLDEETSKKPKKQNKNKVESNNDSFSHSIDTMNRFHDLNVLPPANASEIDQTIKQLQDKIEILKKPSEEAIEAFKVKAAKEFDRIHGFHEQEQEAHEEEKGHRHDKKKEKSGKVELQGADFPELN